MTDLRRDQIPGQAPINAYLGQLMSSRPDDLRTYESEIVEKLKSILYEVSNGRLTVGPEQVPDLAGAALDLIDALTAALDDREF